MGVRSGRGKTHKVTGRDHSDDEERVHSQVRRKEAVKWIKTDHSATANERTRTPPSTLVISHFPF